jgi:hypothetical protein
VLDIPPKLLKEVPHGQKWIMDDDSNLVYIARIEGTAYEMGFAYGQLFKDELAQQLRNVEYMYP